MGTIRQYRTLIYDLNRNNYLGESVATIVVKDLLDSAWLCVFLSI